MSVTSINKWIDEGRFIGVNKSKRNKHNRIPSSVLWRSSSGITIPVNQVVAMYEEENIKRKQLPEEEE